MIKNTLSHKSGNPESLKKKGLKVETLSTKRLLNVSRNFLPFKDIVRPFHQENRKKKFFVIAIYQA